VDKGYYGEPARENIVLRGYIPQVVGGGEEKAGVERLLAYRLALSV
jgi:hypothetical protein